MKLDKVLDKYAAKKIGGGKKYRWWWNGDDVLAEIIARLCEHHLSPESNTAWTDDERVELETLRRYMHGYSIGPLPSSWLHAEAMWLLTRWFSRLWD